jgi:hypothetical protein
MTEGAGAFRPLNQACDIRGFSHGHSVLCCRDEVRAQETRTYLVKWVPCPFAFFANGWESTTLRLVP